MTAVVARKLCVFMLVCAMLTCAAFAKVVVPGGQTVGVALRTNGPVVIGASDVGSVPSPARLAGLKSGDVILAIDGIQPDSATDVGNLLHEGQCRVTYERNGVQYKAEVTPVYSEGAYRLGAWVRDSAAGIGTITYYDPENGTYGALGHPVTDADTGIVLPINEGTIYENTVVGIEKGKSGRAGEILGQFYDGQVLGEITVNDKYGVFGKCEIPMQNDAFPKGIETAPFESIRTGKAVILSAVEGKGIQEYTCEITDIDRRLKDTNRALTIKITDDELIKTTGGIVQGMSGSPIVQDGKLVGAVTHVLVNDPTRGYGIFIENMLDAAG